MTFLPKGLPEGKREGAIARMRLIMMATCKLMTGIIPNPTSEHWKHGRPCEPRGELTGVRRAAITGKITALLNEHIDMLSRKQLQDDEDRRLRLEAAAEAAALSRTARPPHRCQPVGSARCHRP